jgi:dTDP-4-dehydrorhamnose 3,5-epimerase
VRELPLTGVFLVEPEPQSDERGFFARIFDSQHFRKLGLVTHFPEWSVSFNRQTGTLRGMHYQLAPHAEVKLVRCTAGAIYDVVLDLRPDSSTRGRWIATELSADNRRMVYIPEGMAHGFQTLSDAAEVLYHISSPFEPSAARGVRWDDPAFKINWPFVEQRIISVRDRSFPDYIA